MADLDPELLERVLRWCAEAGRQTSAAEIRAALSPLGWDVILNVRALLADPPPARPLGPGALADLARGTPADIAAERERAGLYRPELDAAEGSEAPPATGTASASPRAARPRKGQRRPAGPVVHRRRDRVETPAPPAPSAPPLERLLEPEGRAVLERLIRERGARRSFLLTELSRWRRADGAAPADADLDALLDHHGLARAFSHRERDELLHALRAARGDRPTAAAQLGLSLAAFHDALERLGATAEAERIRDDRRADLRSRATIAERARMLATEPERLEDLGLLAEVEADLRARLGEHLRALRAGAFGSLSAAFARSVSLEEPEAAALARRLGIDLGATDGRSPARQGPRDPAARSFPRRGTAAPERRTGPRERTRTGGGRPGSSGSRPRPSSGRPRPSSGRPGPSSGRPGPSSGRPGPGGGRPRPSSGRPGPGGGRSRPRPGAKGRPGGRPAHPAGKRPPR